MDWILTPPSEGDIVRVKVKFYYHYGIYVSNNEIIQFGLPDNSDTAPDDIEVIATDIKTFLNGGNLETAKLSTKEKLTRRSKKDTIKYAREHIGQKGYNILHNNCEHFATECVFRKPQSAILNNVRTEINTKLGK